MSDIFHPVTMEDREQYRALLAACDTRAADYSFINLWGWAEHYGLEWRFSDDLCWIRQTLPEVRYWAPVGRWDAVDWASCSLLPEAGNFIRVPERLSGLWQEALPGRVSVQETRGQWDYLYKTEDLAALSGNRFHKKKNLFNQFLKLYPGSSYLKMTVECVEAVLKMQEEWCQWRECMVSPTLMAENTAVLRVLQSWDQLPELAGGFIMCEGKVVAYTVGEGVTEDTMVVHFEKGNTAYKGIYQAINALFAKQEQENFTYFNREQDLDDLGLRKAKESYNPVAFVRKDTVEISA